MAQIDVDINTGERYRIFAHVGNSLTAEGVTVSLVLLEEGTSFEFAFWTRQDARDLFARMALAATVTQVTEEDAEESGSLMVEAVTTSWAEFAAARGTGGAVPRSVGAGANGMPV